MTENKPSNPNIGRQGPGSRHQASVLLLLLLTAFSVVLLGMAGIAIASPSTAGSMPSPPLELPPPDGSAGVSVSGATTSNASTANWIVAGRPDPRTRRLATDVGGRQVGTLAGVYRIERGLARQLAGRLDRNGRLVFAEPDVPVVKSGYPKDLYESSQWWLNRIVNTSVTTPPRVSEFSPELALIEESVDPLHPDLLTARIAGAASLSPAQDWHGTAIAGIAGSPGEGSGIRGVWPGMKMRLVPMGTTCSTATDAVTQAVKAGSAVLNMSYGFPGDTCYSHFVATESAVRAGILPVAAAGNTNSDGSNTPMRPATDPHVISVSAIDGSGAVAPFATQNAGVDITAPGVSVFAPTVTIEAGTGAGTGITRAWANLDGTSFSTPMVAAAATWLRQARPDLDARQVGRALTSSALDLGAVGRDPVFGEGSLNIDAALTVTAPSPDPMEPNNDVEWLNGSLLRKKSAFLWKPGKSRRKSITATLSRTKDPADVYRVKIPRRGKVLITTAQLESDVKLEIFKPKVKSILKPGKNLIVRSDRPRTKTEGVRVRNLKRKPQFIYVAVTPSSRTVDEYSRYKLNVFGSK